MGIPPDSTLKVSSTSPSVGETWLDSKPTQQPEAPVSLRAELKELLIPIRSAVEEAQKATWQELTEQVTVLQNSLTVLANQYVEAKQFLAEVGAAQGKQLAATEASLALRVHKVEEALEGLGSRLHFFQEQTVYVHKGLAALESAQQKAAADAQELTTESTRIIAQQFSALTQRFTAHEHRVKVFVTDTHERVQELGDLLVAFERRAVYGLLRRAWGWLRSLYGRLRG